MVDFNVAEIQEVLKERDNTLEKEVKISKDRNQFSLKIPFDLCRELEINPEKDKFKFSLEIKDGEKILTGKLIKK